MGTDEYQSLEFSFYPNPATEQIKIKFGNTLTNHEVEIFDVSGKRLATSKIQQLGNIDISDLATGTYLLKLTSKNKAAVVRFLKQ
ncbi:T9SS type A sorting domain-containing protein [Aequorivita nionensis]|uniref:T9SS type A sorting domain-containing protein n=1 Tax=Aequorivita nionensis TaxID=1287690 RepID=UPI002BA62F34|nr:T9SS type A sorting domain-containing protein [Aequorivita sp.]